MTEKLLDKKIHPTVITKGYQMAAKKCQEILQDISLKITPEDNDVLRQIAMTAMTGKGAEGSKEKLAEIIVKAVNQIKNDERVELNDIKIEKQDKFRRKLQSEWVDVTDFIVKIIKKYQKD